MANEPFDTNIPKIVLDKEDRDAFHRTRNTSGKPTKAESPDNTDVKKGGVSGFWVTLSLIIAVGAGAANYWLYQQKVAQDALLDNAQKRITDLESRLSATGEELDQSAVALQVKVNELSEKANQLWDQMDKLWASAWRKNQSEIKALSSQFADQKNASKQQISVVEGDVSLMNTNLAVLQEQLDNQISAVQQINQSITSLNKNDNDFKRQFGDIQAKLIAVDQVNSAMARRIGELEKWRRSLPNLELKPAEQPVVTTSTQ